MASLPSNTFLCNYNARDYVAATRSFPKEEGQSLNQNLVLANSNVTAHTDNGYCTIRDNQFILSYNTSSSNPFNRYNNNTGRSLTIVYKTSSFSGNLFANRGYVSGTTGDHYNYMVRDTIFHTSTSGFLSMSPSTSPYIAYVRVKADGTCERKCVTTNQIATASSISYGNTPTSCAFFRGFGGTSLSEYYQGDFYWIYISTEALTDEEIQKVIAYNETTTTFETDIEEINAAYTRTTCAVTLTTDEGMAWTASTANNWISISPSQGTGSSVFVVTAAKNTAYAGRNGLVTVTNGEDVIEITVEQAKYPLFIPFENIYRADLEVIKGYRSGSTINKAYRSGELIYYKLDYSQPTPPVPPGPKETPLTFNVTSDGAIKWAKSGSAMQEKTILYKLNDGEWTSITSNSSGSALSISVVSGDTIQFKGDNATYSTGSNAYTYFIASGATFTVSGNIMSLIDSTDFATATVLTEDYALCGLFKSCTGLTDASNLVLPATTLTLGCYRSLFDRCSHLTSGTELPATTLAQDCYRSMFFNCSGLTTAPELPATTLASSCYQYMFAGCTGLTTAPELPATTLVSYCYQYMFQSCTNLNYIKCLATDISASYCTRDWVRTVSSTGTFVTPSSTNWSTGASGIPSGWTRVDA